MERVRKFYKGGPCHLLPGPLAYKALCGAVAGRDSWYPVRADVTLFGDCKRCQTIATKAAAKAVQDG